MLVFISVLIYIFNLIVLVLVNEVIGYFTGIKIGRFLLPVIWLFSSRFYTNKLKDAWMVRKNTSIPENVIAECNTLKGNNVQIYTYLDQCVRKHIISKKQKEELIKEYIEQ